MFVGFIIDIPQFTEEFKEIMSIIFDDGPGKWNYKVIPTVEISEVIF